MQIQGAGEIGFTYPRLHLSRVDCIVMTLVKKKVVWLKTTIVIQILTFLIKNQED